ncbi:hypothetical protein B9G69_012325 [Bdellovibrio sp. SKB1291214]|uniref:hypothetical protein n=1 Tax=Bdellovibrio sp. SKB1291214 TaxID=1732569 RepID=UPI00223EC2D4|nr:hypothetical protein [Bdellovibrio sp. SKB1291214]UYL07832.1 hypothetical protein B9G69_012325 [Bdellovibrio sp. SKB1291214]
MNLLSNLLLILALTLTATLSHAMDADEERLSGFAEHQSKIKRFDEARDGGKRAFLESQEQWDTEKERDLAEYKKNKPQTGLVMNENSPEYREWENKKKAEQAEYEESRKDFAAQSHKRKALDRTAKGLPTLAQELGLDEERPRFDFAKRNFGTKTAGSGGSSGGFGRGGGVSSSSGNSSFPPPPTFDDFQDGYVPAPNISPEDFGDVPPPPPPPMAPSFDGNGFSNGSEFIPPPPPPPGNFESGDF